MEPSTPRTISRPMDEPTVRTALRAACSARPGWRPPRGPVLPNSSSLSPPSSPPPLSSAGAGAAPLPLPVAGLAAGLPCSTSKADSRSTIAS